MEDLFNKQVKAISNMLWLFFLAFLVAIGGMVYLLYFPENDESEEAYQTIGIDLEPQIENGIHVETGFIADEGMEVTIQNCTNCHSAKLVSQNRMTQEGWQATIKWMQETQNLWDLGQNEEIIIRYLAKNYGPADQGRRQNLPEAEWYELN